jgi:hypothetical protein
MKYLAKYGKVWQHKKTAAVRGSELELKKGETLDMFEMVKETQSKDVKPLSVSSDNTKT